MVAFRLRCHRHLDGSRAAGHGRLLGGSTGPGLHYLERQEHSNTHHYNVAQPDERHARVPDQLVCLCPSTLVRQGGVESQGHVLQMTVERSCRPALIHVTQKALILLPKQLSQQPGGA
jgi:hypothetical protein